MEESKYFYERELSVTNHFESYILVCRTVSINQFNESQSEVDEEEPERDRRNFDHSPSN